jgi:hypothetical protein
MEYKLSKADALKLWNASNDKGKQLLSNLFGAETFNKKITDRVDSILDIIDLAAPSEEVLKVMKYNGTDEEMIGLRACARLLLIAKVFNEGWRPEPGERRWFPVFDLSSGFGFSHSTCGTWYTLSRCGSRLAYKTEALSDASAKMFPEIHKEFLTYINQ